jgi:hypothetical protein
MIDSKRLELLFNSYLAFQLLLKKTCIFTKRNMNPQEDWIAQFEADENAIMN